MRFIIFCIKAALIIMAYNKIAKFAEEKTDKFRVLRMISNLNMNPRWSVAPLPQEKQKEIDSILDQPFHYLACGGQCWAFVSDDNRYVIKFFKHHRRDLPSLVKALPLPHDLKEKRERHLANKRRKLERDFDSYKLCFEHLQEETGVVYVHLNKTEDLKKRLTLFDKLKIKHEVDLDGVEFVLQKRAALVHPHIHSLMKAGDLEGARGAIREIIRLICSRCQKGVFDEDPRIHRNFGFIGSQAVIIDVGRLVDDPSRKDPDVIRDDLKKITLRFREWLSNHYPELIPTLEHELEQAL